MRIKSIKNRQNFYYIIWRLLSWHLYYLPLPPNMTMQEKAENQKLLQMSGSMPFRGCSMVHVDKLKETEEEGEIIFSTGGTSGQKRYVCISHEILYQRCMEAYEYDRNEPGHGNIAAYTCSWRYLGFKELLRMVLRNQSVTVAPHKDIDAMIMDTSAASDYICDPKVVDPFVKYHLP